MRLIPREMAKFGQLYLNNGLVVGKQIVTIKWIRESLQYHSGGQ
jgi:CubicO group peptidase (beta-lactamase class C family)